jgi:outer membrane protein TolC
VLRTTSLVLLAAISAKPQEGPELLTLSRAVELALEHNPRVVDSRDNLEQARLSVNLAQSAFRLKVVPNILGSFGQSSLSNQTYGVRFSQRLAFGSLIEANVVSAGSRNQLGDFYNTDTSFLISQPLLRGFGAGVSQREVHRAEAQVAEQMRLTRTTEQQLAVEVASAYYRVVGLSLLVDVASKSLESSRSLLEASRAKLEAGRVSQLDVSRANQLAAEAESQLLDSRGNLEDAKDLLRGLLDLGLDHDFEVSRDIPRLVEALSLEEAVKLALQGRPEMEGAREALAEAERSVNFGRNQLLPQFDVKVGATRQETAPTFWDSFGLNNYHLTTIFAASVPVDRTPEQTQYHSSLIERDRRRRAIDATERRISEEARRAVRRQERLLRTLEVAESRLHFAEQELEVARLRFQRGLANNLDVVNAEENVLSAKSRQIGILAELAVARLGLRAAVGILDPRRELVDPSEPPPLLLEPTHEPDR